MCCCGGFSLVFFTKDHFFSHFLFCLELVSGLEKKAFSQENNIFHNVVINRFVKNGSGMRIGNKPSKNTLTFAGGEGEIKNEIFSTPIPCNLLQENREKSVTLEDL